jgi:hypothetical protein
MPVLLPPVIKLLREWWLAQALNHWEVGGGCWHSAYAYSLRVVLLPIYRLGAPVMVSFVSFVIVVSVAAWVVYCK